MSWLSLLIFLIPSNLFLVLYEPNAYVSGIRIDYLIPKLYLSAVVAAIFVVFTAMVYKKRWLVCWLLLLAVSVWHNWFLAELILVAAVAWSVRQLPEKLLESKQIIWGVTTMLVFQSGVAIWQFVLQKSLFGYWFLGETNLFNFAGIATQTIIGREFILPSGTTSHPNVLAGILVIGAIVFWQRRQNVPHWLTQIVFALTFAALILTTSISALLAGGFVLGFVFGKERLDQVQKKLLLSGLWSLILIVPLTISQLTAVSTNPSIVRRAVLNQVAIGQFWQQPLFGVGLNSFTSNLATNNSFRALERFIQPAHNVPLLVLAETGLVGVFGVLGIFVWLRRQRYSLDTLIIFSCLVVPLLSLDHYLYTLESGRLSMVLLLLIVLQKPKQKELGQVKA